MLIKRGIHWVQNHKVIGYVTSMALLAVGVYNFAILIGGEKARHFVRESMTRVMEKCKKNFKKEKEQ